MRKISEGEYDHTYKVCAECNYKSIVYPAIVKEEDLEGYKVINVNKSKPNCYMCKKEVKVKTLCYWTDKEVKR